MVRAWWVTGGADGVGDLDYVGELGDVEAAVVRTLWARCGW